MRWWKLALAGAVAGLVSAGSADAQSRSRQLSSVEETAFEYNSYYAPDSGPYYAQDDSQPPGDKPLTTGSPDRSDTYAPCGYGCRDFCAACQECPQQGLVLFSGFDSFRGVGDQGNIFSNGSHNYGATMGFNYGTHLGSFSDATGLGFQFGGSYGVYDWDGRPTNLGALTTTQAQQQVFITTGLFKKADGDSNWSYGVVHDWMVNQSWGAFAVNPTLGQWRGQIAYATSAWDEFGFWGTLCDKGDTNLDSFGNAVFTRSINQANLFWHHKWDFAADSWFWVGVPQDSRLDHNLGGSLGNLLIGGSIIAPLNEYVSLYGNMQYMHPSAAPGPIGNGEASWYVAFGLQFYIGGNACSDNVAGNCWLPLMPVANNGNFLVDALRIVPAG